MNLQHKLIEYFFTPFIFIIVCSTTLFSQNKEVDINNSSLKKIKFSGGINLMSQYYNVQGINPRMSPFSWVIAGNAMLSVGKIKIPLRFSFRDQKFNYGGPSFNKYGISPRYKWAKLHLGYRSMRFSKYSLNGKTFFGVGIELKPKYFRFSAFKGKLKNLFAQKDTLVFGGLLISTYSRDAQGIKIGIGNNKNYFDISYLKIKDNIEDIDTIVRSPQIKPIENLVLGTNWKFIVLKRISLSGSINASAYSENETLPIIISEDKYYKFLEKLYNVNSSTKFSAAGELSIKLSLKNLNWGLQYRRIEPNYRSLGISFIQADIQSYTTNTNIILFNRRLIFNAQVGIERNNLRNLDYLTRKRFIYSSRINILPSAKFNIIGHFANYQYQSTDGLVAINDTLRQVSVSRMSGLNINYNNKGQKNTFGSFMSYQRQVVTDQSPIQNIGSNILNNNFSIGGIIKWNELDFSLKPSINYSSFIIARKTQVRFGLGLNIKKTFFDKNLSLNFSSKYSKSKISKENNGFVFSNRLSTQYKINKTQSIKLRFGYLIKSAIIGKSFNELRSTLQYSYKFK